MTEIIPKFKRTMHNYETHKMTYRFTDLVDIPVELDLPSLRNKYSNNLEVTTWIDKIQVEEHEIPIEFTDGAFDADKMKATVISHGYNARNNAIEYLSRLQNFLAAEEAKAEADRRAAEGYDDAELIMGDVAEEGEFPVESETPSNEEPEMPVLASKPKVRKRTTKK